MKTEKQIKAINKRIKDRDLWLYGEYWIGISEGLDWVLENKTNFEECLKEYERRG